DDARPEGESSANRQKTSEYDTYLIGEIDEAQLQKDVNDMLRQRCNLGEEYRCQRDPKALLMTSLNQDLFYLKYGNPGPKKYTLSLHKYPAIPFRDDDIEEQTSRWIFKSLSFCLDRLCRLAILCLDQHAHTLHHLESLLTISLDKLDILKEDLVYQSLCRSLCL
ncbi:hypothetical protein Tco_1150772, partial [Tanacetum coccineum]